MSYLVNPLLCPNYEDNDEYGSKGNAYSGFPDMWPEEMAAEGALYRERQRMKEQRFFLERDDVIRTIMHFKLKPHLPEHILKVALVSLADEQCWEVKNPDAVKYYKVKPIYRTS